MKKKLLSVLLATTMVVGLTACGSKPAADTSAPAKEEAPAKEDAADEAPAEEDGEQGGEAAATGDAWDAWADVDTSEHVVINYMTTGDKPSPEAEVYLNQMLDELNGILTDKINAEIQMYYIPWTDYLSNYNLTLAQMDGSVDLVVTATDWLDAWKNAQSGAFLELSEDMLKTYAPKTWEAVTPDHWEQCKYDGEIYIMPEDQYAQWVNHGFMYRKDWAKDAGLTDGVRSWEDMTTYFKYVRETFPDMLPYDANGGNYNELSWGWMKSHTDFVPIEGIDSSNTFGGTLDDYYTVYSPFLTETDSLVELAKTAKEWSDMGVWKTDVLNNTSTTNRDQYKVGKAAADQHHTQTWIGLASHTPDNVIYQEDPEAETGFFWFGTETNNLVAMSITHGAMAVSAGSENPERALMVYDMLRNDPDCYRLFCYGVQGVSWDLDENGYRINPEGFDPNTMNIGGLTNYWGGRNDNLEIRSATTNWEAVDALFAEYDKVKVDYPYGQFIPDMTNIQSTVNNIGEIQANYLKQLCFGQFKGSAEDFVAEYQQALKNAGIEDVIAELQRQIDELYK